MYNIEYTCMPYCNSMQVSQKQAHNMTWNYLIVIIFVGCTTHNSITYDIYRACEFFLKSQLLQVYIF